MTSEKEESRMLSKDEDNCLSESQHSQDGADKIKILIVEDDQTTQLLYDKGLFNQIFDKKMVVSGKEAILVYEEWHPDIIMLDVYVHEMTGYQVLKAIRTTIKDNETTIVMATSLSDKEDVLSCTKLGIEGYIIKPFSCSEIGAKILGYYAKKKPERAQEAAALCREIAKQSQDKHLDRGKPNTKEDAQDMQDVERGTSDTAAGKAEAEIATDKNPPGE